MDNPSPKAGLRLLGVGAAACTACCAGPILGLLAATGIASVLGAVVFGVVGLIAVLAIAAVLLVRRRRQARQCAPIPTAVALAAPQLKATTAGGGPPPTDARPLDPAGHTAPSPIP